MSEFVDQGLARLRDHGFRVTRGRRLVLYALEKSERPLSPYALREALEREGEHVDTVSIYRILETLEGVGLAHRVASVGGYLPCRMDEQGGCHHHLICRGCGAIREFDCPGIAAVEAEARRETGFQVERHLVELVGLCPACAAAAF